MTQARSEQISLGDTPFYHVVCRCVRRSFLCGLDQYSGNNYDHRRQWFVDRIRELSSIFTIEIASYAVMSNHYHLVVYINEDEAKALSSRQVAERWKFLFDGKALVDAWYATGQEECDSLAVQGLVDEWRSRLSNISWYMKCLNEFIARKANKEDDCKGRFWESRFKSQALLDEKAIISCMAYVDLNPVRAKMAESVETSEFTSIFERIMGASSNNEEQVKKNLSGQITQNSKKPSRKQVPSLKQKHNDKLNAAKLELALKNTKLLGFSGNEFDGQDIKIPFSLIDYFELVDKTGRVVREGKRGFINESVPPLLEVIGLSEEEWLELTCHIGRNKTETQSCFKTSTAVGTVKELNHFASQMGKSWSSGYKQSSHCFH